MGSMAPNGSSMSISGGAAGGGRASPAARGRPAPREGPPYAAALALPARQLAGIAVAQRPVQADEVEQLVDARLDAIALPAEQLWGGRDVVGGQLGGKQPCLQ